jgi:hypothetical protein
MTSSILIGGLEGAIVVWQLDTGKRRFKPRLGSPLLFFAESPDSSISCVSVPFTFWTILCCFLQEFNAFRSIKQVSSIL